MTRLERRLKDILENPEKHAHSYEELSYCCIVDGKWNEKLLEAHGDSGVLQSGVVPDEED